VAELSYQQPPDDRADAPAGPPPGWHPDPEGLQALRWWDGTQWTGHTQPLPEMTPQPQPYRDNNSHDILIFPYSGKALGLWSSRVDGHASTSTSASIISGRSRGSSPAADPGPPMPGFLEPHVNLAQPPRLCFNSKLRSSGYG
jgi:hypothetical protein